MFISIIHVCEIYMETQDASYSKYIRDPYGITLLLDPKGIHCSFQEGAEYPTLTCQQYYEAIMNDDLESILPLMTTKERFWCDAFAGDLKLPRMDVIKAICKENRIDTKQATDTWIIQPNAEAMGFALASPRAMMEGVTPVIGIPLRQCMSTDMVDKIRFPGMVEEYHPNDERIHIHKDGEIFAAYDKDGVQVNLEDLVIAPLEEQMSFVISGFLHSNELIVDDILCWNDIWVYRRPLAERIDMLWRFPEYSTEKMIIRDHAELTEYLREQESVIFRNLNRAYDLSLRDCAIVVASDIQTCILQVGGRRGSKGISYLTTSDKKQVFEIPAPIAKEDRGDLIEVKRDGTVMGIVKNMKPDGWSEVATKWGFELEYDKYGKYRRLPRCTWFE
jgi:hypothetical protein